MERGAAHRPVLPVEVMELLQPDRCGLIVDCTTGLGGHAEMLMEQAGKDSRFIGVDRDESNLRRAKQTLDRFGSRVRLFQANFADIEQVLEHAGETKVDALLADLGIASSQLDDPTRGLSFQSDGPLDMRMDTSSGSTAEELLNTLGEKELADLIYEYGEERYSRRIARAIVEARKTERLTRTGQLAQLVRSALPAPARSSRRGVHPATRTFQALRIAVNREMESLDELLDAIPRILAPGGRAAIISFHSLEDRRVKRAFAEMDRNQIATRLTRKPVTASPQEIEENPRSRSAKLRGIEQNTTCERS